MVGNEFMSVLSKLKSVSVSLCSEDSPVGCDAFEPNTLYSPPLPSAAAEANPFVSCLMVTRGNTELIKYSLASYQRQTYAHRELVVVAESYAGEKVRAFIDSQEALNARVFVAPPGLTLGDHRNLAAARARGAILVNWDDDDVSDPQRLDVSVQALRKSGAAAAFLSRLLVWWPQRKIAAISERRAWEQTITVWRNTMPIYASLARGEDTVAIDGLISKNLVAIVHCPLLYVYVVTGRNTWSARHFEAIFARADCVFEGDEFNELNALLADRLPLLEYAAVVNEEAADKIPG